MKYIHGQNRTQTYLFPVTLDDAINADNEVRMIDLFVDSLSLEIMVSDRLRVKTVVQLIILPIYSNYSFTGT